MRGALHQSYIAAILNQLQDPPSPFPHIKSECTFEWTFLKQNDLLLLLIILLFATQLCDLFILSMASIISIRIMHLLLSLKKANKKKTLINNVLQTSSSTCVRIQCLGPPMCNFHCILLSGSSITNRQFFFYSYEGQCVPNYFWVRISC